MLRLFHPIVRIVLSLTTRVFFCLSRLSALPKRLPRHRRWRHGHPTGFGVCDDRALAAFFRFVVLWDSPRMGRFNVTPDAFAPPPDPIKRLYQLQHGSFKAMCRGERRATTRRGVGWFVMVVEMLAL